MSNIKVAYFSAEIGIDEKIKTYSGGLGILAGDTIKAMADLEIPFCAVTMLYRKGFFKQKIEGDIQTEIEDVWDYEKILTDTKVKVKVNINNTDVIIKVWKYEYKGITGHRIPIYFLGTGLNENPDWAKDLTEKLYQGDRLSQEIILGVGGVRALDALGHSKTIQKYHMNEGHSSLLTLELYRKFGEESNNWEDNAVKEKCSFTTHTPIPAGHDKFDYNDFYKKLEGERNLIPLHIKKLAGEKELNMTKLAISLSSFVNGVSVKHTQVTRQMFPFDEIHHITNGVHATSWVNKYIGEIFDSYLTGWREDNCKLKDVFKIPNSQIYEAHKKAKKELIEFVNNHNVVNCKLKEDILTIGFARRFISYKDAELIFKNFENLKRLGKKVQFIFAGKSHSNDGVGKDIMKRIIDHAKELENEISIAFVENYDINISKQMVAGCDLWLNTPIPFNEASGTSGMKAVVNGCLHFSRLDGWAIEAFEMNSGGFPIYEYEDLIITLEYKIIPMFYSESKTCWVELMKLAIGNGGSFFNTHRMAKEYLQKSYKIK